jgi:hypothetical protein
MFDKRNGLSIDGGTLILPGLSNYANTQETDANHNQDDNSYSKPVQKFTLHVALQIK